MGGEYPADWHLIAARVKRDAGGRCVRCGHEHDPANAYTLTVHHLDMRKDNCRWWNLVALCQRCHLSVQARVILERAFIHEHSEWFKIYAAAWYAFSYLGEELTREQTAERLEELLSHEHLLSGHRQLRNGGQ